MSATSHSWPGTQLERVARELHEQQCSGRKPWDERPDFHKQMHRDDARKILVVLGLLKDEDS